MARLGSIAAAPFLGDQFVSLYLGSARVPTVPGKPTASSEYADGNLRVTVFHPDDGGSPILQYRVYVDGEVFGTVEPFSLEVNPVLLEISSGESQVGRTLRLSAINAIGEGPQSDPVTVAAVV